MSIIPPPRPPASGPPAGPPIKLKIRPDLSFDQMQYQGVEYWVVKEPLGQKYFQFPPHVFYLLQQLDGTKTIEELQDGYHREYAPKRITRQDLQQLLTRFHQDGLVTSDLPGQGSELLKRGQKNRRMELLGQFANILAIRYKGFDPERILNFLLPYTWWIFTKAAVFVTMILAAVALCSVLANWAAFQAKLPGFEAFFDPRQWWLFALVLCVTKVFHEFGHGLSCKRLGGECHEIGFMLLVLTPCLYCNVSDSWRLPNKWHRAAIGAAGMYVEVILATLATFVWWFVQPGFIQDICLKVMLVSSISTILFNGNPLLRFDGYYILSDILEIPNLSQKSNKALTTLLGRHWLGLEIPDDQLMPTNRPVAFAMFTVASFCYRWFIMFSIIYFLMTMLEPYNLESVGVAIAMFSIAGMVVMPGYKLYKYMSVPGRMHQVKKVRFSVIAAIVVGVLTLLLCVPLPFYLRCNLIVMPQEIDTVWVNQPGRLESVEIVEGQTVTRGQPLATLRNTDLELQLIDLRGRIEVKEIELAHEQARIGIDGGGMYRRAAIAAELKGLKNDERLLAEQVDQLVLKSPIDGTILALPYQHQGKNNDEVAEAALQPLLRGQHVGVTLPRSHRFCEVAGLKQWYIYVALTEHQVKFAKPEQQVRLKLYSDAGGELQGTVESIGTAEFSIKRQNYEPNQQDLMPEVDRTPDRLTEMLAAFQQKDFQYYARVKIAEDAEGLRVGMGGQARIFVEYRSLGFRLWWWFNQNFRA